MRSSQRGSEIVDVNEHIQLASGAVPATVFHCVLEYVHGGWAQLSEATMVLTMQLADFLQMAELRTLCGHFIASHLRVDNAAAILEAALAVGDAWLGARCMEFIEANISKVFNCCWITDRFCNPML